MHSTKYVTIIIRDIPMERWGVSDGGIRRRVMLRGSGKMFWIVAMSE